VTHGYPVAVIRRWESSIVDDLTLHPQPGDAPLSDLGGRSLLRQSIKFGGRTIGGLAFLSFEPACYTSTDLVVGRRLADHVASALSHHHLAEESRRAAALRARADSLDMLDGLLDTLTGVLDIREVFARVSEVTREVLPHDGLSILEILDGGARARVHASHGLGELTMPHDVPLPKPALAPERHEVRIIPDYLERPEYAQGPGVRAGMRSSLFVTIRLDGQTWGGVNFYSRTVGRYTAADGHVARRVADHIALALSHSRLADQVRITEELRARATELELVDQLLAAVADHGELADVIDRVSDITRRLLPHDATLLGVFLPDGVRIQRFVSTSGWDASTAPAIIERPLDLRGDDWDHSIVDDLSINPTDGMAVAVRLGFRSALRMAVRLEGRIVAAFVFLSRTVGAFRTEDVLVGRRVADRIALRLSRDRGFEAVRRADEATERASRLEARVRALTDELDARTGYRRVVGESKLWRQVLTQATQVAATETTALLLGESGTGKEVVARFVHRASPRGAGPFVAINCAALPEQLLEAELFGYERGAFTGATQSKPGQLEQAAGGTLFLDEVGEMSPSAQAKFLRVLQEREFQRLGGTRVLRSEARVVAATNRDLLKAIGLGQFREDLYYRLNVFAIRLPALRERRDDILPLADAFLSEIGRGLGRPPAGISKDARELLIAYHWPGNVRELRNILERAAILCEGGLITAEYLGLQVPPPAVAAPVAAPSVAASAAAAPAQVEPAAATATAVAVASPPSSADDLASIEKAMIETALQQARFNKSKAAKGLGMTRHQLYIRMRKHGLE
jgi:two-component system response regulator FlrC